MYCSNLYFGFNTDDLKCMTRLTELMMNDISFKAKRPIYSMDILCDIAEQNLDYAKQFIITVQPVFFFFIYFYISNHCLSI
jgi:hypothetical protein